jgi:hypothetical protein
MAITCPRCGSEFDATLFQFGQRVRCHCGVEIEYPGTDQRSGHVLAPGEAKAVAIAATTDRKTLDPRVGHPSTPGGGTDHDDVDQDHDHQDPSPFATPKPFY